MSEFLTGFGRDISRGGRYRRYRGNEAIASPRDSFDEDGMVGVISQRIAEFLQRAVQAEIEIDESVSRPEPLLQFLTRNHFAGMFQQGLKYLKGLLLELDPGPALRSSPAGKLTSKTPNRSTLGVWADFDIEPPS